MPDWTEFLVLALGTWQVYGLFFLLGSLSVSTLSDLRRLAAQSEFREVWAVFAVAMLVVDLRQEAWEPGVVFGAKWVLIVALSVLSWERVGVVFRLASADVFACAAVASLLTPALVLVFWGLLKVGSWVLPPILPRRGNAYPFLPVVTVAALLVLGGALFLPAAVDAAGA